VDFTDDVLGLHGLHGLF
jgi:hypothetical protein